MKKLFIFIFLFVFIIFGGVAYLSLKGEALIAGGVSDEGSKSLGTKVVLADVKLSPFVGEVQLSGFSIGQPKGFGDGDLMTMDDFIIKLKPASLLSKHIQIDVVDLDGFTINAVMMDGKTNIQALQDKLGPADKGEAAPDIKISAKSIRLRNMKASFQKDDGKKHEVALADIKLSNLGVDQNGMAPKEMLRHTLAALQPQIAKAAVKIGLKSKLKGLEDKLPPEVKGLKDKAKGLLGRFKKKKKKDN